jgi:hypothetical protein
MAPGFSSYRKIDPLVGYYLATPLFAIADLGFGMSVRVAGLEEPWHRGVYYAVAFGCGALCRLHPSATPWVGMLESSASLLLLLLSVLLPIWSLPEAAASGAPLTLPYDMQSLVNTLISGTALIWAFQRSRAGVEPPRP